VVPGKSYGTKPKGNLWIHGTVNHQEADQHLEIYALHIKTEEFERDFFKKIII